MVQQRRRLYGFDADYATDDEIVWLDSPNENVEASPEREHFMKRSRKPPRKRQALTSRSKLNRKPDKLRREFVRQYPCCNPNCKTPRSPVDWSHMGHKTDSGMAMKPPDDQTAPLCYHCHIGEFHKRGNLPGMTAEETRDLHWRWIENHRAEWEEYQKTQEVF